MRHFWAAAVTVLLLATNVIVADVHAASTSGDTQANDTQANQVGKAWLDRQQVPSLDTGVVAPLSALSLTVGQDKKTAGAQLNVVSSDNLILNANVSGPIERQNGPVTLGDLDGLADDVKLTFTLQKHQRPTLKFSGDKEGQAASFRQQQQLCKEYARKTGKKYSEETCDPDFFDRSDQTLYQDRWFETLVSNLSELNLTYFGLKGSIGRRSFSYMEQDALGDTLKEQDTDFSLDGYVGQFLSLRSMVVGGLRYEESHQGQSKQQICLPFSPGVVLKCQDAAIGAPAKKEKVVAYAAYRMISAKYAIDLGVYHDLKNNETGIRVPIWILQSSEGLFSGGVQIDWTSETDDVAALAFVGLPFRAF